MSVITSALEDVSEFPFAKFAATYFTSAVSHTWLRRHLREPLLHHDEDTDIGAALAVWTTILRFMGDLAEPRNQGPTDVRNEPIMNQINKTIGRAARHKQRMINQTLKKKSKFNNIEDRFRSFTDHPTSSLEKIHFIIGTGIIRPELRDEILCQICKQLTQNPARLSQQKGWILLSLCLGCFGPSELFEKYLRCFIRQNQTRFVKYFEDKLRRTMQNGPRQQPPSWVELQAAKIKRHIQINVTLMDSSQHPIKSDSATTAREITQAIAERAELTDDFGFSLFITLFDKVSSLGAGDEHVLDAISQCEQFAKEQGIREGTAPWKIVYRKEVFTPWYNPLIDIKATNLIRNQIVRGIQFGEYQVDDVRLSSLAAQEYACRYGKVLNKANVDKIVRDIVPEEKQRVANWTQRIQREMTKLEQSNQAFQQPQLNPSAVSAHMVRQCRQFWTLPFSRFYEVVASSRDSKFLLHGASQSLIIAINWSGIYAIDPNENLLLTIKFLEIKHIDLVRNSVEN